MNIARKSLIAAGVAIASFVPFACAGSDTEARDEDAGGDAGTSLETSVPLADASADARVAPCSDAGFCSVPRPFEAPIVALSASSLDDAWVVSDDTLAHWNGASWEYVYRNSHGGGAPEGGVALDGSGRDPGGGFQGLWVAKKDDAWATGPQFVVHYSKERGAQKLAAAQSPGTAAWVPPASDAIWFTSAGIVYRYREQTDGTLAEDWFTPQHEAQWKSIWGFADDDVYAGGSILVGFSETYGVIAHYDGVAWTATRLGKDEPVHALFGTRAADRPKQLWAWTGVRDPYESSINTLRLFSTKNDGIDAPLFSKSILLGHPVYSWCSRIAGSAASPTVAWFSDGCILYRWTGAGLEVTPTALGEVPMGRTNGVWADDDDEGWIAGEALSQGPGTPTVGFVAQRKDAGKSGGP